VLKRGEDGRAERKFNEYAGRAHSSSGVRVTGEGVKLGASCEGGSTWGSVGRIFPTPGITIPRHAAGDGCSRSRRRRLAAGGHCVFRDAGGNLSRDWEPAIMGLTCWGVRVSRLAAVGVILAEFEPTGLL